MAQAEKICEILSIQHGSEVENLCSKLPAASRQEWCIIYVSWCKICWARSGFIPACLTTSCSLCDMLQSSLSFITLVTLSLVYLIKKSQVWHPPPTYFLDNVTGRYYKRLNMWSSKIISLSESKSNVSYGNHQPWTWCHLPWLCIDSERWCNPISQNIRKISLGAKRWINS